MQASFAPMPDIVLTTLNARYIHAAFGLRYLMANLQNLQPRACLREFDINQRPTDVAEQLLALDPTVIGIGVYIWNVDPVLDLVRILKRIRPQTTVVVGGPEVSHEWDTQPVAAEADYLITGEADLAFRDLCAAILAGHPPNERVLHAQPPTFADLKLPYSLYSGEDVANRILYVEASRGCPFRCEFCLSSLDIPVRQADVDPFLSAMDCLLNKGARHLKFVDRTFNLNLTVSRQILEFCLKRHQPGMLFHFEMVPDRLPHALREIIQQFPAGALQFEVGIQTFNESVAARIDRRQNNDRATDNLRWLRQHTGVHIHADLIAGLPGESLDSFAAGFDRLVALAPHEIQLGILKRLRGTPIARHDETWSMVYNPAPPYEILSNSELNFETIQSLKRFARFWDLTANSGNFVESTALLLASDPSAFRAFHRWTSWVHARTGRTNAIALTRLVELFREYLVDVLGLPPEQAASALLRDYQRNGRSDVPETLRSDTGSPPGRRQRKISIPAKRQQRHLASPKPES